MAKNQDTYSRLIRPPVGDAEILRIPEMSFLMVDGKGDPNTSVDYRDVLQSLYCVAYALKFGLKKRDSSLDFKVAPIEGLWWVEDLTEFSLAAKGNWNWTSMIMMPAQVTKELFEAALEDAQKKKGFPSLSRVRLEAFDEGLVAQTMHIGPYAAEESTIQLLHEHIRASGHSMTGKHHEIYLSDPRRAVPEKMKTVIRQPVR